MEHGRRPPAESPENNSSDEEPAPNLPRRSAFEYLREMLQRSHEKSYGQEDDDDDESLDDTGKKKRRIRHFIGDMLARKEVKKTTLESDEVATEAPLKSERPLLSGVVDVEPPASVLTPDLAEESASTRDVDAVSTLDGVELSPSRNETDYAASHRSTARPERTSSTTTEESELPTNDVDDTTEVALPPSPIAQELPLNGQAHAAEVNIPLHDQSEQAGGRQAFDRTERVTERVIERGSNAPIVTLMAAEVLSRHRDKKLRRTDEAQAKQIAELADTQRKHVEAQTRAIPKPLEVPVIAPAPERLDPALAVPAETVAPKKVEKKPSPNKLSKSIEPEAKPAKLAPEQVMPLPEASKPESLAEILKTSHFEKTNSKEAAKPVESSPHKVLEKVKEAAEVGMPIEDLFEHRHEARDEAKQQAGNNSAVTSISHPGDSGVKPVVPSQGLPTDQANDDSVLAKLNNPQFKKAAISGFWTALVIITVLIIIAILG